MCATTPVGMTNRTGYRPAHPYQWCQ